MRARRERPGRRRVGRRLRRRRTLGLGALAVARVGGGWRIGWYEDGVDLGPHILAVAYEDYEHTVLGLNDDYAVGIQDGYRNAAVPERSGRRVVRLRSSIRSRTNAHA